MKAPLIRAPSICEYGQQQLRNLKIAIKNIPTSTLPEAADNDIIATFASKPQTLSADDTWEILDPMLNRLVGYGATVEEVATRLRSGERGLIALHHYIEHCVVGNGVSGVLLEGKIEVLMAAIRAVSGVGDESDQTMHNNKTYQEAESYTGHVEQQLGDHQGDWASDDEIVFVKTVPPPTKCEGLVLAFPPGQTATASYPFMLHDKRGLPWNFNWQNGTMTLRALSCSGQAVVKQQCTACSNLEQNTLLVNIREQIAHGIHENAPFAYYGCSALVNLLHRKNTIIDHLCLHHLNDARKLVGQNTSLDQHKQMLLALASEKIPRIDRVLRAGFNRNLGMSNMLDLVKRAAEGTYHPKSFDEKDDLQALLILRLGGGRVANIAHRMFGTP
ncbi:hypothetical protein EWM64_g2219, partial [Hericium alpestre]